MIKKIKFIYRNIFPNNLRLILRNIYKYFFYKIRFLKLYITLFNNKKVKLILGAALTNQVGWLSTNEEWLDISNKRDWRRLFKGRKLLRRAIAEHVFEHLTKEQMINAFQLIYEHLYEGGTLRIAVPDGNHPDQTYRKNTGINGIGADAADHKQFLSFETLKYELEKVGFKCFQIEGYNKKGELIAKNLPPELGYIHRTRQNKDKFSRQGWEFKDAQTSLIVDAYK